MDGDREQDDAPLTEEEILTEGKLDDRVDEGADDEGGEDAAA